MNCCHGTNRGLHITGSSTTQATVISVSASASYASCTQALDGEQNCGLGQAHADAREGGYTWSMEVLSGCSGQGGLLEHCSVPGGLCEVEAFACHVSGMRLNGRQCVGHCWLP